MSTASHLRAAYREQLLLLSIHEWLLPAAEPPGTCPEGGGGGGLRCILYDRTEAGRNTKFIR